MTCVKVEVSVPNSSCGLSGLKATLNSTVLELMTCVKVEVSILGPQSLIALMVSVEVKQD